MSPLIEVRTATPDDAAGTAGVHVRAWQVAYRGMVPDDHLDTLDLAERTETWRDIYRDGPWARANRNGAPAADNLVATADGEVVGFISVGHERDRRDQPGPGTGELWALYVDPPWWGTPVGHRLMGAGVDLLSAQFPEAVLWVLRDNARARRFYERAGWSPDGGAHDEVLGGAPVPEVRYRIRF